MPQRPRRRKRTRRQWWRRRGYQSGARRGRTSPAEEEEVDKPKERGCDRQDRRRKDVQLRASTRTRPERRRFDGGAGRRAAGSRRSRGPQPVNRSGGQDKGGDAEVSRPPPPSSSAMPLLPRPDVCQVRPGDLDGRTPTASNCAEGPAGGGARPAASAPSRSSRPSCKPTGRPTVRQGRSPRSLGHAIATYKGQPKAKGSASALFDTDLKNLKVLAKLLDKLDLKSDGATARTRTATSSPPPPSRRLHARGRTPRFGEASSRLASTTSVPNVYRGDERRLTMEYIDAIKMSDIDAVEGRPRQGQARGAPTPSSRRSSRRATSTATRTPATCSATRRATSSTSTAG